MYQDMAELASITSWMFQQEISIPQDVVNLMVPGEQPVAAYATFRDSAIFTTKRLIVCDARRLWHKKMEAQSLPYLIITTWSSVRYGFVNTLELWTIHGKISVGKQVDVRRLDMLIAMCVLGE